MRVIRGRRFSKLLQKISKIGNFREFSKVSKIGNFREFSKVSKIGNFREFSKVSKTGNFREFSKISKIGNFREFSKVSRIGASVWVGEEPVCCGAATLGGAKASIPVPGEADHVPARGGEGGWGAYAADPVVAARRWQRLVRRDRCFLVGVLPTRHPRVSHGVTDRYLWSRRPPTSQSSSSAFALFASCAHVQ